MIAVETDGTAHVMPSETADYVATLRGMTEDDNPFAGSPTDAGLVPSFLSVSHHLADLIEAMWAADPVDGGANARDLLEAMGSYLPPHTAAELETLEHYAWGSTDPILSYPTH